MKKGIVYLLFFVVVVSILFTTMSFSVSAASSFSYSYVDTPLVTLEMKKYIEGANVATADDRVLVLLTPSYAQEWYDGNTWEQIATLADNAENRLRTLAVDDIDYPKFYSFRNYNTAYDDVLLNSVRYPDREYIADRLFALRDGYRYENQRYNVERIYWFDASDAPGNPFGGGYAAIVTNAGVFFEHYNLIYGKEDKNEYKVLTFTQKEFEEWYPQFIKPEICRVKSGLSDGTSTNLISFDTYLTANGFTPRYGEAQGVARRVLTFGGIGLVGLALVGGTTYAIIRKKRKKKAARLSASVETTP